MATNFDFLKSTDKNLFDIITEAEKLYRDEYFEQCMTQTRRFAENVCKDVLGNKRTSEETFDDMLATLKDKAEGNPQEKEFLDDMYFLKRKGNKSTHSSTVKKDGITALECLQRAFEVAISYSVYKNGPSDKLLRMQYDTELLVTGKKNKSLAERYNEKKIQYKKTKTKELPQKKVQTTKKNQKQKSKPAAKSKTKSKIPVFGIVMLIAFTISLTIIGFLFLTSLRPY